MDSSPVIDHARGRALPYKKQFVLSLPMNLKLMRHIHLGLSARHIIGVGIFLNLHEEKIHKTLALPLHVGVYLPPYHGQWFYQL
jgi:hypothetical protein